jgi:phosphoinositide-3-kinase regulatory subunit 4
MTLKEHKSAVNRLVVSPDQSYFASASSDHTVRVWQTKTLDKLSYPKSSAVYKGHQGPVIDAATVEGTHSIASVSKDSTVQVWRVDMVIDTTAASALTASSNAAGSTLPADFYHLNPMRSTAVVNGTSLVRKIDSSEEGELLAVQHFNSDIASVVTYATQYGGIHGWDLRTPSEVFRYAIRPELGYITAMSVSPEKYWFCLGTNKGIVQLWDIRYNLSLRSWKHSANDSIYRLASGKSIKKGAGNNSNLSGLPTTEGGYLFVSSGNNETAVFDIPEGGECLKCFRSLSLDNTKETMTSLPSLDEVIMPRSSTAPLSSSLLSLLAKNQVSSTSSSSDPRYAVKAMIGRISANHSSYLITAGSDRHIRYWDFRSAESCYTVAGLEVTQLKSIYRKIDEKVHNQKLFICYTPTIPATDKILQSHLPLREGRGLTAPSGNFKVRNSLFVFFLVV